MSDETTPAVPPSPEPFPEVSHAVTPELPKKRPVGGYRGVPPPAARRFGQPGANPRCASGKPKGFYPLSKAYTDLLSWPREDLDAFLADAAPKETRIERVPLPDRLAKKIKGSHLVARGMFLAAMTPGTQGQVRAAEAIADRTEGKVVQPHDVDARVSTVADLVRQLEGDEAVAVLAPILPGGQA